MSSLGIHGSPDIDVDVDSLPDEGQQTMANSISVAIASDQSAIPVTDNSGSLTVDNAALSVTGGGVEATALRVTLASDSTGVVSVDDNAGSLTVDGPLTDNELRASPVVISGAVVTI